MLPVAPCNVNDASYVRGISHESHFSGQARYLETLEGERGCSAQSPRIVNCEDGFLILRYTCGKKKL